MKNVKSYICGPICYIRAHLNSYLYILLYHLYHIK